jgi:hypothetical protein
MSPVNDSNYAHIRYPPSLQQPFEPSSALSRGHAHQPPQKQPYSFPPPNSIRLHGGRNSFAVSPQSPSGSFLSNPVSPPSRGSGHSTFEFRLPINQNYVRRSTPGLATPTSPWSSQPTSGQVSPASPELPLPDPIETPATYSDIVHDTPILEHPTPTNPILLNPNQPFSFPNSATPGPASPKEPIPANPRRPRKYSCVLCTRVFDRPSTLSKVSLPRATHFLRV